MVAVEFAEQFKKQFSKLKDKEPIKKQLKKIIENPNIGKPMRYGRKGTREVYIAPYRLAYAYENDTIYILALYHKDEQ